MGKNSQSSKGNLVDEILQSAERKRSARVSGWFGFLVLLGVTALIMYFASARGTPPEAGSYGEAAGAANGKSSAGQTDSPPRERMEPIPSSEGEGPESPSPDELRTLRPVRPGNGDELQPGVASGRGKLTVENFTQADAAVKLMADAGGGLVTRRLFFVRAMSRVTIDGIPEGSYRLRYQTGNQWSTPLLRFTDSAETLEVERPLVFEERRTGDGITTSHLSLTLHKVRDGNTRTKKVADTGF